MTIVQQPTFIDIEILMQLDIKERNAEAEIFSPIDFTPISLNYEVAIRALVARII